MKNKIALINIPESTINAITHYCEEFYNLYFYKSKIPSHIVSTAHGILIFGISNQEISKATETFTGPIVEVNSETIIHQLISDPLKFFDDNFGRIRKVNPLQFNLMKGSVVKSKNLPSLGKGIVTLIEGDQALVKFINAKKMNMKDEILCHKSILRVITHICEVSDEYDCKDFE